MPPDLSRSKTGAPHVNAPLPPSPGAGVGALERRQIPPSPIDPPRFKFRARFRKAGDLRLVSHHDLMHVVERMFRRADLNLSVTQGFNPRPKMAFALSLALGVAGLNEVFEFEVASAVTAEEVERRLRQQCPPGLEILSVRAIDVRASARVRLARYRLHTPREAGLDAADAALVADFLSRTEYWTERTRPRPRRVNIRPYVRTLHLDENCLEMELWITSNGAARPEEVIQALGMGAWLDAGAVIERTDLELADESPPDAEAPPEIPATFEEITTTDPEPPTASRPTAIFDSPMSFDS